MFLKQSTAFTFRLGPFVDSTDGVTAETGLTLSQADYRLSKAGGAFAQKNETTSGTHNENGWYTCILDATDTNTLGTLDIAVHESGALPVFTRFIVLPANVYDSLVAGSDTLDVQVTGIGANVITATSINADAITAAKVASDVSAEIADAVWDEDATGHQTGGTFGQAIGDPGADTTTIYQSVVTDAAGTNVAADIIAVKAETASIQSDTNDIQARLPAALVSGRIDASVGAMAANVMTAAAAAADLTTELQTGLATSAELVSEINSVQTDIAALSIPTAAAIADAVWDEDATAHQTQGTFGQAIGDPVADTNTIFKAVVTDAAGATVGADTTAILEDTGTTLQAELDGIQADTEDIQTRLPAALVSGRIDASVGAMAANVMTAAAAAADLTTELQSGLATATDLATVDTVVDAIKVQTDKFVFTVANQVDANIQSVNDVTVTGTGAAGDEWGP